MTLAEFKAWFEGFTEDMEAAPTPKQWKRIKARVGQIDGVSVTREVIYRDRYWPSIIDTHQPIISWGVTTAVGQPTLAGGAGVSASNNMLMDLGRAEYSAARAS